MCTLTASIIHRQKWINVSVTRRPLASAGWSVFCYFAFSLLSNKFIFSNPARGMLHKREKLEGVELRPKTLYTHIQLHIYIYIWFLWSQHNSFFFSVVEHAAGRIRFINLNQAAGPTKFCLRLDLACGPDFGHACPRMRVMIYVDTLPFASLSPQHQLLWNVVFTEILDQLTNTNQKSSRQFNMINWIEQHDYKYDLTEGICYVQHSGWWVIGITFFMIVKYPALRRHLVNPSPLLVRFYKRYKK